jgi:hypothetical protein
MAKKRVFDPQSKAVTGVNRIAARLGISPRACADHLETGTIPAKQIGRMWVGHEDVLDAWLREPSNQPKLNERATLAPCDDDESAPALCKSVEEEQTS